MGAMKFAHSQLGGDGQEGHYADQGWCPESDVYEQEEETQSALECGCM